MKSILQTCVFLLVLIKYLDGSSVYRPPDAAEIMRNRGRKAYFGVDGTYTFEEAKQVCAQRGGQLATIFNVDDAKMAWLNRTRTAAFIGAWRKLDQNGTNGTSSQWFMGASVPLNWSNARYSEDAGDRYNCYAMAKDGIWDQVSCSKRLAVMCDVYVVPDANVRSVDPRAKSKFFVAFNNGTDLFTEGNAKSECWKIGGHMAKIRSNTQQLSALAAMNYNRSVFLDRITKDKYGYFRWSDNTRVSWTQLHRLCRWKGKDMKMSSSMCVSLNKFGDWNVSEKCPQKLGALCEITYLGMSTVNYTDIYDFETDIRMDVDFDLVTRTDVNEGLFRRAFEAEVMKQLKIRKTTVEDVVIVYLKRGSTVVTIRVWTREAGRKEAKALQSAISSGDFRVNFMGTMIHAFKDQDLPIRYTMIICIFPIPAKRFYWVAIPVVLSVIVLVAVIILIVCLKKRKRRQTQVDSEIKAKQKKELEAEEEKKKGVLPEYDSPPSYIQYSMVMPPNYEECVNPNPNQLKT